MFRFFQSGLSAIMPKVGLALLAMSLSGPVLANQGSSPGPLMDRSEIMSAVRGKRIYIVVPLGGEIPLYYRDDGYVDGSGEAVGLGRFLAPTDSGKWWVEENRLCQQWTKWYEGRVFCFTLQALAANRLIWYRDDGEEGTARIEK